MSFDNWRWLLSFINWIYICCRLLMNYFSHLVTWYTITFALDMRRYVYILLCSLQRLQYRCCVYFSLFLTTSVNNSWAAGLHQFRCRGRLEIQTSPFLRFVDNTMSIFGQFLLQVKIVYFRPLILPPPPPLYPEKKI